MAYKPKNKKYEPKTPTANPDAIIEIEAQEKPEAVVEETVQAVEVPAEPFQGELEKAPEPEPGVVAPQVQPESAPVEERSTATNFANLVNFIYMKYEELELAQKTCPTTQHRREVDVRMHSVGEIVAYIKTL